MQESTQSGDSALSVDDAAAKLMARYETKAEPENEVTPEETQETEVTDEVETEVEAESADDIDATEATEEETFQNLEELAEATGMELEDFLKTIKAKTKVDGKESEVSLSDVLKGYQLESTFTRRNEAFINQQKEWEQRVQREQAELQSYMQKTGYAFKLAQDQLTHEFNAIDWRQLEADDPQAYMLKRQKFGERQAQIDHAINQATQTAQQAMQRQEQQRQQRQAQLLAEQDRLLLKALPSWSKAETREKESKEITEFLLKQGYTPDEVSTLSDHRVILMARNAIKGTKVATEADIAEKKVKQAPKLVKSNARQNVNQGQQLIKKVHSRLKKSGDIDDAAQLLLARGRI